MRKLSLVVALTLMICLAFPTAGFAAAPQGSLISNTLAWEVNVEEDKVSPTILVNQDLASNSAVGLYDLFTVTTEPGDYADELVRVKIELNQGEDSGLELYYQEQDPNHNDYEKYLPLTLDNGEAWFGPGSGFPLGEVSDSAFMVKWTEAETYEFNLEIVRVDDDTVLANTTVSVNVSSDDPVELTWDNGEPKDSILVAEEFEAGVTASLVANVDHVDHALYVIEVQKKDGEGWVAAAVGDFQITKVNGSEDTQGINNTFTQVDGMLQGYWGPREGFLFDEDTTTSFEAKFVNSGEYKVEIHAIQVDFEVNYQFAY